MIDTKLIIQELNMFILKFGGIYRNFYVGITDNPKYRLNYDHNIGQANPHYFMEAGNAEAAKTIKRYFIDQGCHGESGVNEGSVVYVYKKGPRTKP